MASTLVAEHDFNEAIEFLSPILWPADVQRRNPGASLSLADALIPSGNTDEVLQDGAASRVVAERVMAHLRAIHASLTQAGNKSDEVDTVLQTPEYQRVIDTLLDLLSVEGIYAYFLPGVGVPIEKRMRAIMDKYEVAVERSTNTVPRDPIINQAIDLLSILSQDAIFSRIVFQRNIVDLLAISFQYAYMPEAADPEIKSRLETTLARVPLNHLYPCLTALIHPAAPTWMKAVVSARLALLPMRQHGVRETVVFLSTAQGPARSQGSSQPSQSQFLTQELLDRLVKIVCKVPISVEADRWFESMVGQLLAMLDSADKDSQAVASYTLGTILSRRQIGSPGTLGWKYGAEPILAALSLEHFSSTQYQEGTTLAPSQQLELAAQRLARLLTLHPNPGLVKRLCSRVLLPVWALACGPQNRAGLGSTDAVQVLKAYFKVAGAQAITTVLDNIRYDGPVNVQFDWVMDGHWRPMPSARAASATPINVIKSLEHVSARIEVLMSFLQDTDSEDLSELCVLVIRRWIGSTQQLPEPSTPDAQSTDASHERFVHLKFLQSMLETMTPKLAASSKQFVPLVIEIISSCLQGQGHPSTNGSVGIQNLATISQQQNRASGFTDDVLSMLGISLGLLTILLMDEKQFMSVTERPVCTSLGSNLESLIRQPRLPADIKQTAQALLHQLSSAMGLGAASPQKVDQEQDDNAKHRAAMDKISDPNPPIRAEGLADLNKLITKSSPTVSVPSTVIVLESLLRESDEYTHLSAIRTLVILGTHYTAKTLDQLMTMFVDPSEESTLDARLKLAEVMQRIVSQSSSQLGANTATKVAESAMLVGGRRPERVKEATRRAKDQKLQDRKKQAAERSGTRIRLAEDDEAEEVTPADEVAAQLLERWAGSGREEDVRVRTSAMSILDAVLVNAFASLQQSSVEAALELILNVLRQEKDEGAAIIRRAAILCLQTLVSQANSVGSIQNRVALDSQLLGDALACLEDTIRDETDEVARGHAMAVQKMIEEEQRDALEVKLRGEDIRFDLGGHLRGLDVTPMASGQPRPVIEEIE